MATKIKAAQINQDAAFTALVRSVQNNGAVLLVVSVAYAATVTPNADTTNVLNVGALTGPLTLANPTGTPTDGQLLLIRLKASASDRVVTLASGYAVPSSATIGSPFTVVSGTSTEIGFRWNTLDSKWRFLSYVYGF